MSTEGKGEGRKGAAGKGPGNEVGGRRAGCRAAGWEPGGSSARRRNVMVESAYQQLDNSQINHSIAHTYR